jgi:hypothetical protein
MSKLRPECGVGKNPTLPYDTILFLIRDSVAKRRELIHGCLNDGRGNHCAMGAFWEDNPKISVKSGVVDEVAAINDSLGPNASAKDRWKKVNQWLRFKIASLTKKAASAK